ncbi:hypothetical protein A9995_08185 [Erythrobacter sp. QSSC1-22B]|uniref:hypothetical protein n=1 Tax=Erythrobacter sp. QSSC1-22B TaxID=1860125 RepID=UPI000805714D|nr:hypothetical protein [Erythrobacter sp. QSSC1-22B]OBX19111.1 hypothetical protein A9995_08185 [Erythrobacter sp. QSSC1-22B]
MFRISIGVAALALAASGTLAQNTGQPAAERAAERAAEQRSDPPGAERPGNARDQRDAQRGTAAPAENSQPSKVDLRPLREIEPKAQQVVGEILSNQDRREARVPPQPAADRAEPPARNQPTQTANRLRDFFSRDGQSRDGHEGVFERMLAGPLDRTARMLVRCPPGLAKTGGCQAPGQAKSRSRQRESLLGTAYTPQLFGLPGFDPGRYLYRDGFLLRLANGAAADKGIAGYIPLLGGALAGGNIWPGSYGSQTVHAYLIDFYNLGQPGSYRYADNTLYRVDPQSAVIQSVVALLVDEDISVGEPLPAGYDVYNVPYPLRDRYADSAETNYRYVDGYVYRVDPDTRLVTAAIDLLT